MTLYFKYFGFREAPFNVTPDPKFFYDSARHREGLAALYYGITGRKGFVVITGEVGTGKTTLIRTVLRNLEANHRAVFIFNTLLSFDELLQNVLQDLGLSPSGLSRVAMLNQLNEFLLDQVKTGHIVSLLIDEAQHLGEDTLEAVRLLSNLETDKEKLLQIILVGQPELDVKLSARSLRQLKQRVALRFRLDRLAQGDIENYVRHRLNIAGYDGPEIFSKATIAALWQYTMGTPRLINAICDNALLTAFALSKKTIAPEMIQEVAYDLYIRPVAECGEFVVPDAAELERRQAKHVAKIIDLGKAGNEQRGRSFKPERDKPRVKREISAEPITELGAAREFYPRPESAAAVAPDLQPNYLRREASRVAALAEHAEKKHQEKTGAVEGQEANLAPTRLHHSDHVSPKPRDFLGYGQDSGLLPPTFFDDMLVALTEAMGPMARFVLSDQVSSMGESVQRFPKARLPHLLGLLAQEILNDNLRRQFQEQMMRAAQVHNWR